jgi:hypothetical protein
VELEGLQFMESMGFMLDNLNFRNLPADAQEKTLRRIPLFFPGAGPAPAAPPPAPAAPAAHPAEASAPASAPPADDAARIARLLASF